MTPKKSQQTTPAVSSSADESEDALVSDEYEEVDSSGSDSGSAEEAAKRKQQQSNAAPSPKSIEKQAVVAPAPAGAKVGKKRAREEEIANGKKVVETEVSKVGGEDSKTPFARVFSEDDDIKVLKGMLDYWSSKGQDPSKNGPDFFNYVIKSLSAVDVTLVQLRRKIRNLKEKYENNVRMCVDTFDKPHDRMCYNLAEKIWGDLNENGKMKSSSSMSIMHDLGKQTPPSPVRAVKEGSYYSLAELIKSKDAPGMSLRHDILKKGLELLGEEVRAGFDGEWKDLVMAEAELYYKRLELTCKQVKLILDAHKASRN